MAADRFGRGEGTADASGLPDSNGSAGEGWLSMEQGEAKIKVNPVYSGSQNRAGAQSPELLYGREGVKVWLALPAARHSRLQAASSMPHARCQPARCDHRRRRPRGGGRTLAHCPWPGRERPGRPRRAGPSSRGTLWRRMGRDGAVERGEKQLWRRWLCSAVNNDGVRAALAAPQSAL